MILRFSTRRIIGSRLISIWVRGFAHVGILTRDNKLLSAELIGGVCVQDLPTDYIDYTDVELPFDIEPAARGYIGLKYDFRSLAAFLLRIRWANPNHMFCSELIARACRDAGYPLVSLTQETLIDPQGLFDVVQAYLLGVSHGCKN